LLPQHLYGKRFSFTPNQSYEGKEIHVEYVGEDNIRTDRVNLLTEKFGHAS
jgi:hypothetical protein